MSMEKVRVYELAKELNTTSKRLMEKLAEINVVVKNHMSLLEEHELEALYKHIGVIRHDEKAESEEKKQAQAIPPQPRPEIKREASKAPRIIRTTEIIINSKNDDRDNQQYKKGSYTGGDAGGRRGSPRHDFVISSDSNSGLRAGFVRDNRDDLLKELSRLKKEQAKAEQEAKEVKKDGVKLDTAAKPAQTAAKKPVDTGDRSSAVQVGNKTAASESRKEVQDKKDIQEKKAEPAVNQIESKAEIKAKQQDEKAVADTKPATAAVTEAEKKEAAKVQEKQAHKVEETVKPAEKTDVKKADENLQPEKTAMDKEHDTKVPAQEKTEAEKQQDQVNKQKSEKTNLQGEKHSDDKAKQQDKKAQGGVSQVQAGKHQQQGVKDAGDKSQADRQQQGSRPQGKRADEKPQGDKQQLHASKAKDEAGHRTAGKPLDIPKPELTYAQKDLIGLQKNESRRDYSGKDFDKDSKRELRKETAKLQAAGKGNKKVKPINIGLSEKKGVHEILSEDFFLDEFYDDTDSKKKKSGKGKKEKEAQQKHIPPKAVLTSIKIPESITVKDLAEALKKTSTEVIKKLMSYGIMATLNEEVDFDTATIIAEEFGVKTEKEVVVNEEDILFDDSEDDPSKLVPRPPVVVVMGHVDHGKTSLLDAIRSTNVIESEAGGITQHIGAYMVKVNGNRTITFLDTPGHEAFTAMRARGAQVTDIAILVVAADDGVMPQTIEAINHAKAANVSIIVAINKIDKPGANPERVKQELAQHGLVSEDWGGDVICVNVSAKKRENIDQLLEMVLLTADMLELKANPDRQAKGTVIEAKLDKNRGPIATVLVQRGTLRVGDSILTGVTVGRIRAMTDDKGNSVKSAGPSTPVEILGLPEVPEAGELFYAIEDEKIARHLAEKRKLKLKEQQLNKTPKVSLDELFKQIQEGNIKELNIIIKADVQGSVEAMKQSLEKLSNDEVHVKIIHGGVGAITESDVTLASVSNAIIIGFNVRPGANVMEAAHSAGVDIRLYRVIYNAIEDIEAAMKGMLEPTFKEVILGHTEVRQIFKVSGVGTIAGCYVSDGKVSRNSDVRVIRDGIVIHEGKLASLKRFKDDVKEVLQGFECGLSIEKFNDIKEGDIIEAYVMEEVKQ